MRRASPLLALLLGGCCYWTNVDTRVMPREDGSISAISVAREESTAANENVREANRYCEKQSQSAVFTTESTEYQGLLTERGGKLARVVKNIPAIGDRLTSDEDYRVTTQFKCVASHDVTH